MGYSCERHLKLKSSTRHAAQSFHALSSCCSSTDHGHVLGMLAQRLQLFSGCSVALMDTDSDSEFDILGAQLQRSSRATPPPTALDIVKNDIARHGSTQSHRRHAVPKWATCAVTGKKFGKWSQSDSSNLTSLSSGKFCGANFWPFWVLPHVWSIRHQILAGKHICMFCLLFGPYKK